MAVAALQGLQHLAQGARGLWLGHARADLGGGGESPRGVGDSSGLAVGLGCGPRIAPRIGFGDPPWGSAAQVDRSGAVGRGGTPRALGKRTSGALRRGAAPERLGWKRREEMSQEGSPGKGAIAPIDMHTGVPMMGS